MTRLLPLLLALLLAPAAQALIFDDGGVNVLDYAVPDTDPVLVRDSLAGDPTTLRVIIGGSIGTPTSSGTSAVEGISRMVVAGGFINNVDLADDASLVVYGGNVRHTTLLEELGTTPSTRALFFGGEIGGDILVGHGVVEMYGLQDDFFLLTHTNEPGATVPPVTWLYVEEAEVDGAPVALPFTLDFTNSSFPNTLVEVRFPGMAPLERVAIQVDGMGVAEQGQVHIVPEPSQMALLVPGVLALSVMGRRRA